MCYYISHNSCIYMKIRHEEDFLESCKHLLTILYNIMDFESKFELKKENNIISVYKTEISNGYIWTSQIKECIYTFQLLQNKEHEIISSREKEHKDCKEKLNKENETLKSLRGNVPYHGPITIPSFEIMMAVDSCLLNKWIELDKKETYFANIVFNACKQNFHESYIIWLIEKGFNVSSFDTSIIAQQGNLNLLKYYHEHNLPFNYWTANDLVKTGNLDALKWLFTTDKIDVLKQDPSKQDLSNKCFISLNTAVCNNNLEMLIFLKEKQCLLLSYNCSIWYYLKYNIQSGTIRH